MVSRDVTQPGVRHVRAGLPIRECRYRADAPPVFSPHPSERVVGSELEPMAVGEFTPVLGSMEMAFAKLKAHLRRIGVCTFIKVFKAIARVCDLFSPDQCWNYFQRRMAGVRA